MDYGQEDISPTFIPDIKQDYISSSSPEPISITVEAATGGEISVEVLPTDSIIYLQEVICRKLKLLRKRVTLLYRDQVLSGSTVAESGLADGSRIRLLPIVESGILNQTPEQSVMAALARLTDDQVNNFLNGEKPLHLSMRLVDHVMFIQLNLSTKTVPVKRKRKRNSSGETEKISSALSAQNGRAAIARQLLPSLDISALTNASTNLSAKLKQLTEIVPPEPSAPSPSDSQKPKNPSSVSSSESSSKGAVIESMKHHGHGVYSGTFSGTLNPSLQDADGNPKRELGTIVHILNDLLGATPQVRSTPCSEVTKQTHNESTEACPPTKKQCAETPEEVDEHQQTREKLTRLQAMMQKRRQQRTVVRVGGESRRAKNV